MDFKRHLIDEIPTILILQKKFYVGVIRYELRRKELMDASVKFTRMKGA